MSQRADTVLPGGKKFLRYVALVTGRQDRLHDGRVVQLLLLIQLTCDRLADKTDK